MTTWSELPATSRTIWNPVQQDSATFLETRAETGGRYSLIDIECAPGGGNALHIHTTFAETFEVAAGELTLRIGREERVLRPGERATVPPGTPHCPPMDPAPARAAAAIG